MVSIVIVYVLPMVFGIGCLVRTSDMTIASKKVLLSRLLSCMLVLSIFKLDYAPRICSVFVSHNKQSYCIELSKL